MTSPIDDTLPFHHEGDEPTDRQQAWVATVRIVIPCRDRNGTTVDSEAAACDYVSETLRDQFLDWSYDQPPVEIEVFEPYVEGSAFID